MLKKKTMALLLVLMTAITWISAAGEIYAAETYTEKVTATNLILDNKEAQSVQSVAGGKVHMVVELRLKEGYCIEPQFTFTAKDGSSLSFDNIKVSNGNDKNASWIYIDTKEHVVLEYDVLVDDFAKIGKQTYEISYDIPKDFYDEDSILDPDLIEPGNLTMEVSVINEMIPPQMSIVSGTEHTVAAGEILLLNFTLENEGELLALDTYVEADYSAYDKILIPQYTPLKQKLGSMRFGQSKEITLTYKVAEDAKTEVIKLPIVITYKLENGVAESTSAYVYVYVEGKPEVTPTPTPVTAKTAMLLLNSVKQSPSKPKAGENITVSFYLQNAGTADAKNIKVLPTGLSSNGFEPLTSEPYQYINEIKAGKKQKVELNLRVGKNIAEGLNTLNVQYTYDVDGEHGITTESEVITLYILDVQNPDEGESAVSRPKLMVSNFYTDVAEVKAGGVFDFTFEIMNTNDSIDAKNIKVTVTGASNAFSVTAGGNSFFVNKIAAQETTPITINLKASAAVTTGAYPIQIRMEYEYEGMIATATYSGEVVEEEILLQVKENLRPSVENVYVGSWDTPVVNQPTVMNFEFYNMGKSTLNNTYVTIEGDFMLSNGSNSYYIGNISAGMPEYIEFDVVPLVEGDAVGKMIIHMEDSNGDEVTMEKEFTAYVMGEMMWEDPGMMDPGYMDPGYMDPSMPADGNVAEKPIVPLWLFLCIQGAILAIVIPVTRAIRLAAYRNRIKREDAI